MDPNSGEGLKAVTGAADGLKSGGRAVALGDVGKDTQSKAEGKPAAPLSSFSFSKIDRDWDTSIDRGERIRSTTAALSVQVLLSFCGELTRAIDLGIEGEVKEGEAGGGVEEVEKSGTNIGGK